MLNKVQVIGRLGAKPEIRYLDSGQAVAKFSLASSEKFTNKRGELVERTEWFRVEFWGKIAEVCEKYLDKGSLVYVEGKQKTDQYTDKDGNKKTFVKLAGLRLLMLGRNEPSTNKGAEVENKGHDDTIPEKEPDLPTEQIDDLPF